MKQKRSVASKPEATRNASRSSPSKYPERNKQEFIGNSNQRSYTSYLASFEYTECTPTQRVHIESTRVANYIVHFTKCSASTWRENRFRKQSRTTLCGRAAFFVPCPSEFSFLDTCTFRLERRDVAIPVSALRCVAFRCFMLKADIGNSVLRASGTYKRE